MEDNGERPWTFSKTIALAELGAAYKVWRSPYSGQASAIGLQCPKWNATPGASLCGRGHACTFRHSSNVPEIIKSLMWAKLLQNDPPPSSPFWKQLDDIWPLTLKRALMSAQQDASLQHLLQDALNDLVGERATAATETFTAGQAHSLAGGGESSKAGAAEAAAGAVHATQGKPETKYLHAALTVHAARAAAPLFGAAADAAPSLARSLSAHLASPALNRGNERKRLWSKTCAELQQDQTHGREAWAQTLGTSLPEAKQRRSMPKAEKETRPGIQPAKHLLPAPAQPRAERFAGPTSTEHAAQHRSAVSVAEQAALAKWQEAKAACAKAPKRSAEKLALKALRVQARVDAVSAIRKTRMGKSSWVSWPGRRS